MENYLKSKFKEDTKKLVDCLKSNTPFILCGEQGKGKDLFKKIVLEFFPSSKIETRNDYLKNKDLEEICLSEKIDISELDKLKKAIKDL